MCTCAVNNRYPQGSLVVVDLITLHHQRFRTTTQHISKISTQLLFVIPIPCPGMLARSTPQWSVQRGRFCGRDTPAAIWPLPYRWPRSKMGALHQAIASPSSTPPWAQPEWARTNPIHTDTHTHRHRHTHTQTQTHTNTHRHTHTCVCMCVYLYVCVYIYICTYIHTYIYTYVHIYTIYMCIYVYTYAYARVYVYVHLYV
jgi:hypothetical protein